MTSTFRLTRAEFKKIFKRPSVFIMALLIVATIFASLYLFDPATIANPTVDYNKTTSLEYYNAFGSNIENSQSDIDDLYNFTIDNINYYEILYYRNEALTQQHRDIIDTINAMKNAPNSTEKDINYRNLREQLYNFYNYYTNFDNFKSINSEQYPHVEYSKTYIQYHDEYVTNINFIKPVEDLLNLIDNKYTANEFIQAYDVNSYEARLQDFLDNGINFIETTFLGISHEIHSNLTQFSSYLNNQANATHYTNYGKNLLNSIKTYEEYFDVVTKFQTPIVTISEKECIDIKNTLEEAKVAIDIYSSGKADYNTNVNALVKLNNIKINTACENFAKNINQVNIPHSVIKDLKEKLNIVNVNRGSLIDEIDACQDDSGITNIQFAVTEYKLLAEAFANYTNDNIKLNITDNFNADAYNNFNGYNFKDFKKYETNERITMNRYYIENNIYANSFNTNFAFNQKSSYTDETNVYDFMYFAMEICSIIIIVFAMMLMCNLITGETESGTIKLLLVRPYKRSKIITSKLLATLFFVFIFILFSSILTFVGGYFMFGITDMPVLAVFNASTPIALHPFVLMLINIASLLLDVIFYVILALMLAILFKNYAGSITCSLVILIIVFALNLLMGNSFIFTILPGMNLHLFKYFGNSYIPVSSSLLKNVLITGIASTMTFVYSILMYLAYIFVFIAIAYSVFAKRDF